jgi:hypothetical protein
MVVAELPDEVHESRRLGALRIQIGVHHVFVGRQGDSLRRHALSKPAVSGVIESSVYAQRL